MRRRGGLGLRLLRPRSLRPRSRSRSPPRSRSRSRPAPPSRSRSRSRPPPRSRFGLGERRLSARAAAPERPPRRCARRARGGPGLRLQDFRWRACTERCACRGVTDAAGGSGSVCFAAAAVLDREPSTMSHVAPGTLPAQECGAPAAPLVAAAAAPAPSAGASPALEGCRLSPAPAETRHVVWRLMMGAHAVALQHQGARDAISSACSKSTMACMMNKRQGTNALPVRANWQECRMSGAQPTPSTSALAILFVTSLPQPLASVLGKHVCDLLDLSCSGRASTVSAWEKPAVLALISRNNKKKDFHEFLAAWRLLLSSQRLSRAHARALHRTCSAAACTALLQLTGQCVVPRRQALAGVHTRVS